MRTATLICLALLLLMFQPALGQPTVTKNCISQEPVNMGDIGKERYNFIYDGSLSPGETDWLTFKVTDTGVRFFVKVSESDDGSYSSPEFGLLAYDENMDMVASGDENNILLELDPGTYYLRLDARPYEEFNYTLIANSNFETEPNDGLSEANDLGTVSESLLFGGSIDPSGDADFFKFDLAGEENAKLKIESEEGVSLALYTYNESKGYYLPEYTNTYSLLASLDPGTYYLRILDRYSNTYNYTVSIDVVFCDDEPNDSFEEAVSLGTLNASSPLTANGCIDPYEDEDYFKFEVLENTSVTIKTITKRDTTLTLYDSNEKELSYNDDYKGLLASRIVEDLEPGVYYVNVNGYGSGIEYKISVKEGAEEETDEYATRAEQWL